MRKVYCLLVVLFLWIDASAQNTDTVRKDTSRRVVEIDANKMGEHKNALFVVDGVILEGDVKQVDPKNISHVTILRPPGSVNIYGPRGVNGAVLISTRAAEKERDARRHDTVYKDTSNRAVIINTKNPADKPLILVDGLVYKGNVNDLDVNNISEISVRRDSSYLKVFGKAAASGVILITTKGHTSIHEPAKKDTVYNRGLPDDAMYVIDGTLSDKKLDGVDPKDILSINVIKENKNAEPTEANGGRATIIVVTKPRAIISYKKKFSEFSPAYKEYLDNHNNDDAGLAYTIDGYNCDTGMDGLTRLYKLPKEKLSKIKISTKGNVVKADITTKK
jgi:hypothetical protein